MTNKLKISIVIPNYNYDKYIGSTIDSIILQDYPNKEIVIVDDGSTDNSWNIIANYSNKYPQLIKCFQQENQGQASALNTALQHITGDIIGWINSDDTFCKDVFSVIMKEFSQNQQIEIVYGNINIVDLNDKLIHKVKHFKFSYFNSVFLGFGSTLSSNAVFWKKDLLKTSGLFNSTFRCGLDSDFFSRLTHGKNVKYVNVEIANFRKQPITKAAVGNPEWNKLMANEAEQVFKKSYAKLKISKYVPFRIGKYLKQIVVNYRRLSKFFSGRYFQVRYEIAQYNQLVQKSKSEATKK